MPLVTLVLAEDCRFAMLCGPTYGPMRNPAATFVGRSVVVAVTAVEATLRGWRRRLALGRLRLDQGMTGVLGPGRLRAHRVQAAAAMAASGMVARTALVDRLLTASGGVVVCAVALDRVAPIDPDTFQILASPWRPIEAMTLRAVLGVGVDEVVRRRGRRPVRRHAAEGRLILCAPSGVLRGPPRIRLPSARLPMRTS
jgi:hypothetical protein